jgi:hypothetical protein
VLAGVTSIVRDGPLRKLKVQTAEWLAEAWLAGTTRLFGSMCNPDAAKALPQDERPKVIVGGYPVKAGLIKAIPAAELLADISMLQIAI